MLICKMLLADAVGWKGQARSHLSWRNPRPLMPLAALRHAMERPSKNAIQRVEVMETDDTYEATKTPPLLSVRNLSKRFGPIMALEGVSFEIEPGEVLGVVGQRGSGKSTLFQLLSGVNLPSGGEIHFCGRRVTLASAAHAQKLGIASVHQNPCLAENLTVLQNIFLGQEMCNWPRLQIWPNDGKMIEAVQSLFAEFEIDIRLVHERPTSLSNEYRQFAALAHALLRPSRLLLLDETLTAFSYKRQQIILKRIEQLAAQGVAVIISSDDLKHIFAITHRILVLYQGRQAALRPTAETTPRQIVELIVGSNRQDQITPVIWAFEAYHAAQQQTEELRRAQQELRQSLKAQDSLNRQLVERMHAQVEALDRLNLALQEANRRLMTEREAERKALARDLHDQIIQDLLSYTYQLEELQNAVAEESERLEVADIRNGLRQVVSSLRQICSDLRPPTIDSHGLAAAIWSLAHQWSKQTGIQVELDIDAELGRLPEPIELSVFRIIQEGLSNVRKHTHASWVKLSLKRTPTASLIVQLIDNGQGLERPLNLARLSEEKHFGLVGISERVSLLGGTMRINSRPAAGMELLIEIPSPYPSISL